MFVVQFIAFLSAFCLSVVAAEHSVSTVETNPLIDSNDYSPSEPQCSCRCRCEVPQCNQPSPWTTQPPIWRGVIPSTSPTPAGLPGEPTREPTAFPTTETLDFPTFPPQIGSFQSSMGSGMFSYQST